jgi:hypothetical protein
MDINNYISSGIIEMYVMDLCTPEEKREVEELRKQYPALNEAILQFETSLEKNLIAHANLPGDEADKKILDSLRSLQTKSAAVPAQQGIIKKMSWLKFTAAASVILLLISGILNFILLQKTNSQQALIEKEKLSPLPLSHYQILQQPTITPVAMYGVAPHSICRCTLFWDKKTGKAYIMLHHLPLSSGNESYQLWATVNGKPVSIGIINDKIRDRFIEVNNVPQSAVAFTVTLEKRGGASLPTLEETYLSGKI